MKLLSKKVIIPFVIVFLFVLFVTPISVHQINKKISEVINTQSQDIVRNFEKQSGLNIEWEKLQFKLLSFSIHLKDVTLNNANTKSSKKNQLLSFLDGDQIIKDIFIRPNIFSIFFKKKVILSKVKIKKADIHLQTIHQKLQADTKQDFYFPIKKIIIKDSNARVIHKDTIFNLAKIDFTISKKRSRGYKFKTHVKETKIAEEDSFSIRSRGQIQKNQIHFKKLKFSNKKIASHFDTANFYLDQKGLKKIIIKSTGTLPFSFYNQFLHIIGKQKINLKSLISYSLNFKFDRDSGYKGNFNAKGDSFVFNDTSYKKFLFQGQFLNKTIFIDSGFIETIADSTINIQKAELLLTKKPFSYTFFIKTFNLPFSFISKDILKVDLPIVADINGEIKCIGTFDLKNAECAIQNHSDNFSLLDESNKNEFISIYDIQSNMDLKWKDNVLNFTITGNKKSNSFDLKGEQKESTNFNLQGSYNEKKESLKVSAEGKIQIPKDMHFHGVNGIEADLTLKNGLLSIVKNKITASGHLSTPLLKAKDYTVKYINGNFLYQNRKLSFTNLKSHNSQSTYKASYIIDFKNEKSDLDVNLSFFNILDIKEALEKKLKLPEDIKGTGEASFSLTNYWKDYKKNSFSLKGNLFNASINNELFQSIDFDVLLFGKKGIINNLLLKKESGKVSIFGNFDNKFKLDLNLNGTNLSLTSLNFFNQLFPFNQSGILNFNLGVKGSLQNPKAEGDISITKSQLYTYPINDTNAKIKIDRKGFLISGNIMNKLSIKKLYYPFAKSKNIEIQGDLIGLDFVKILLAKNQKEVNDNYYSSIRGNINLKINRLNKKYLSGNLDIDNLFIFKNKKWIKSTKPFSVNFSRSSWLLKPVSFTQHNNQNVTITNQNSNRFYVKGNTFLSFFIFLIPELNELDGNIQLNASINKNIKNLQPKGTAKIQNGLISIEDLFDIANIQSAIKINGSNFAISNFSGAMGEGSVSAKGSLSYNFSDPLAINVSAKLKNIYFKVYKDFLTKGDGSLSIKGAKSPYLLSGNYSITSGKMTTELGQQSDVIKKYSSFEEEKSQKTSPFLFNIKAKTQKPIIINNSILKSSITGKVTLKGSSNYPIIKGNLSFLNKIGNENLIFFRDQEFDILSGSIRYNNSPPDNPLINIKAKTLFTEKVIDTFETNQETKTEYQIFLDVRGEAKNLQFLLTSKPSVEEKEIISMLTLGMSSKHFDANVKQNITGYSYHLLGSILLQQSLNKQFSNLLGVNLNISPHINILNEPVTKITLRKTWLDKFNTSFSRTIEEFPTSDAKVKYDLKPNVSLTAFWENTEHIEADPNDKQKMGVDFEFNFDF